MGAANEVKGWNTYDSPALITIQKQEGRHLGILFKANNYQMLFIGSLSADGQQLEMVNSIGAFTFSVLDDKISGCGVARSSGTFDRWLNNYHASCNEWVAVK